MYKSDGEEQEINYHYQLESGIRLITKKPFKPLIGDPQSFYYNGECTVIVKDVSPFKSQNFKLNEKIVCAWEVVVK